MGGYSFLILVLFLFGVRHSGWELTSDVKNGCGNIGLFSILVKMTSMAGREIAEWGFDLVGCMFLDCLLFQCIPRYYQFRK